MVSRCTALGFALIGAITSTPLTAQASPPPIRRPLTPVMPILRVGQPDLTVENIREERGTILADIRNLGDAPSSPTTVALNVRGAAPVEQDFAGLPGRAVRTVRFMRPADANALQIAIDPAGTVAEANERNNRSAMVPLAVAPVVATGRDAVGGRRPIIIGRPPVVVDRPPIVIGRRPPLTGPPVGVLPVGGASLAGRKVFDNVDSGPINEIVPPSGITTSARSGAVTLRSNGYRSTMQALPPIRSIPIAAIRANPRIRLGRTDVDFTPMLSNPKALVNIANKMRGISQLAEVRADTIEVVEVRQGLVIRSFLTYALKPGACSDAARRAQVAQTGVQCFSPRGAAARTASFANPADARYVANPTQRATLLAEASSQAATIDAEIAANVSAFRAQIANPAQRAELTAGLGAAEVQRLQTLDDTALAGEMINSGNTDIEQVAFVPTSDKAEKTTGSSKLPPAAPIKPPADINVSYPLGTHIFLTGFTLGRDYEWSQRVEKSIKWCVFGCKKTYYAQVYAGFTYGFGLRFPIRFDGEYKYSKVGDVEKGEMVGRIEPINGTPADYAASGLGSGQIFDGKELVAEVSARAGFGANLPFYPAVNVDFSVGKDFTTGLPAPFTNGQFDPPAPGQELAAEVKFDDFDLIGGRANFGVFGAKVFPAVRVSVTSSKLEMRVVDALNNNSVPLVPGSGPIALSLEAVTRASAFRVEKPVYNLTLGVEPGIVARLFIDLGVWGNNWDWPIWSPDLKLTLPPGGVDFGCHANTVCSRDFRFTPKGSQTPVEGEVLKRQAVFEAKWLPQCLDETCRFAIKFIGYGTMLAGKKYTDLTVPTYKQLAILDVEAEKSAAAVILDSKARKAQQASNGWAQLAQAIWTKQCKDLQCYDEVKLIASQMGPRAAVLRKAFPEESDLKVQGMVNKEAGPKFKQAVDSSKARASAVPVP